MNAIDCHAHLDQLEDLDSALAQARDAGVTGIMAVGVDLASNRRNLDIVRLGADIPIRLGLGLHPGEIVSDQIEETITHIRDNISSAQAVGEIGLDFWYKWVRKDQARKDEQREVFRRQVEIARDRDLPVIIHSRGAWAQCLEIVRAAGVNKGVFHWYSGPVDVMQEILEQGFYVSCTPSVAYSPEARKAMAAAPMERTLIETDCPVYFKNRETGEGFRASPASVLKTLELYAGLKGIPPQDAAGILNQNARDLFGF